MNEKDIVTNDLYKELGEIYKVKKTNILSFPK